jgi:hypothetical protein
MPEHRPASQIGGFMDRKVQPELRNCWFCRADNPAYDPICGRCGHHADDGDD